MSDQSPILGLPYILPSQAQKHVTHNQAIDRLDVLVQLRIKTRGRSSPPASPVSDACYLVATGASGDWAGKEGQIAVWRDTYWDYVIPLEGWQAYVLDEDTSILFDGALWGVPAVSLQNLPGIGLNTTSDANNRLASKANSTLLTHDGAGHQVKVNKSSTSDTASVVFQKDFDGHAEMGLVGNNDFQVKVSPDGTNFMSALAVDAATAITKAACVSSGVVTINQDATVDIPTPSTGGFVLILNLGNQADELDFPKIKHSGIFIYDSGPSLNSIPIFMGDNMDDNGTVVMSGTTSTSGQTGFSVGPGAVSLENRANGIRTYSYTFLGSG